MKYHKLTPEEERIIKHKGTEAPHSGEYDNFFQDGVYVCKRCGAFLYRSEDKFDGHCGWPSFDQEIHGAVRRLADPDGRRTEIECARCGAHLGHVFEGEKFTQKDTRHCVNSLSMKFIPRKEAGISEEMIVLGGGCFWCTEAVFEKIKGVISVQSGYAGGTTENPTYEQVSMGKTGHAEVVKIVFDPTVISLEAILEIFFTTHNPTTLNQQGADIGSQYRSIILYDTDQQGEIARNVINSLEKQKLFDASIVTQIEKLKTFYPAEDYHHHYFEKHPEAAYCQAVIAPKLAKLRNLHKDFMR